MYSLIVDNAFTLVNIVALYRINIHIISEVVFFFKVYVFLLKKSGELIHWYFFTTIEIWTASARYINIS